MKPEWEQAVREGATDRLGALLETGTDIDALDRYGQTGLMLAAAEGRSEVVRWLVDHGAILDYTARYGLSALMLAVVRGDTESVRLLVAAGADTGLRGTGPPGFDDKTAFDLAVARGDSAMIEILS